MSEKVASSNMPDKASSKPSAGQQTEKRSARRYRVSFKVYIRRGAGNVTFGRAHNLSLKGVYLDYEVSLKSGMMVHMAFDLLINAEFRRVFVKARVMRAVYCGARGMYELAFNFTEFARDSAQYLEQYIGWREKKSQT